MSSESNQTYTAFRGTQLVANGRLDDVALKVKRLGGDGVLVFSDETGKEMDFDLRGRDKDVLQRLQVFLSPAPSADEAPRGPGRPKLGVVAREVSLLPRHWEWLSTQSGGASAALRRLIEDARKATSGREAIRQAQDRAYKMMSALAGNLPRYEDALRALYAKDKKTFKGEIVDWPPDVRDYALRMAAPAFGDE